VVTSNCIPRGTPFSTSKRSQREIIHSPGATLFN
jgi:hypothetical protein